jgi:hypothetical protein
MSDKICSNCLEKENNNYIVKTITKSMLESLPSFHTTMIRDQRYLYTFWLWCDTTKCDLALVRRLS